MTEKMLTREEIVDTFVSLIDLIREARPGQCEGAPKRCSCLLCKTDALCATALHYMAEVERLRPVAEAAQISVREGRATPGLRGAVETLKRLEEAEGK